LFTYSVDRTLIALRKGIIVLRDLRLPGTHDIRPLHTTLGLVPEHML
jgi:hypothetical protein